MRKISAMYGLHFELFKLVEIGGGSYPNEEELSRKRPHEVLDNNISIVKKKKLTIETNKELQKGGEMHSSSVFPDTLSFAPAMNEERVHRTARKPLQTSNKDDVYSQGYVRSGKGISDIDEFDENSGDLFIHAESEIFNEQEDRQLQGKYSSNMKKKKSKMSVICNYYPLVQVHRKWLWSPIFSLMLHLLLISLLLAVMVVGCTCDSELWRV